MPLTGSDLESDVIIEIVQTQRQEDGVGKTWPPDATEEERSLRLFKDALMGHAATAVVLSDEDEEDRRRAAAEVEDAYARVREYSPEELEGDGAPTYAEVLTALRRKSRGLEVTLPPRRVLAHMLAGLDYYFFALPDLGYVYDMPRLTDEERAAEHGLRHDLLLKLYDELEPAFDVSLSWPPQGYEMGEDGVLIKDDVNRMEVIGFDCGYDFLVFHEGHADDEDYVSGFVEGSLERLLDQDEQEESDYLRDLWEHGDEADREHVLFVLREECEVLEGCCDERPELPV